MVEGLNKTILIGGLGRDPELRYTRNGQAKLSIRLATTETFRNRDNELQERTDWHNIILWGKRGEALNQVLSKGDRVCIEGRIQTRSYEDDQGKKRYWTEVIATNILLLSSKHIQSEDIESTSDTSRNGCAMGGVHEDSIPF